MLDKATTDSLAQRLDEAECSKVLIRAFTLEHPDLTIEDAYAIQRASAGPPRRASTGRRGGAGGIVHPSGVEHTGKS